MSEATKTKLRPRLREETSGILRDLQNHIQDTSKNAPGRSKFEDEQGKISYDRIIRDGLRRLRRIKLDPDKHILED